MGEQKGYTRTISTAELTETPRVTLEQPTGDVHVEAWDRPEIEVSCSDPDALFDVQQNGAEIIVHNRPGSFKLVNFVEPVAAEMKGFGINVEKLDLDKVASKVERKVERGMRRFSKGFSMNIDLGRWMSGRDYYIKTPHNCNLSLRTSSGDVHVNGVIGTLFLQSTSGDVRLERVGGNTLVNSSSGDVRIKGLEGRLGARSASGDIEIEGASLQEVNVTTASGDIDLELVSMPEREWEIKTVSGDVDIFLPGDARLTAQVHTLSGDVNCGFPRAQVSYNPGRGRGESTLLINGGGPLARFTTVSGDVSVKPARGSAMPAQAQGSYTTDLSSFSGYQGQGEVGVGASDSGDITEPEGYAARRQAELEILQAVERGEISSQEAMHRLSELDR